MHQFNTFSIAHPLQQAIAGYLAEKPQGARGLAAFFQAKRDRLRAALAGSGFALPPAQGTYFQLLDFSALSPAGDLGFRRAAAHRGGRGHHPAVAVLRVAAAAALRTPVHRQAGRDPRRGRAAPEPLCADPAGRGAREHAARLAACSSRSRGRTRRANRAHFAALLKPLAGQTDLVVLPETFTTGFSMEVERLGEPAGGRRPCSGCSEQAALLDAAVTGSVITAGGRPLLQPAAVGDARPAGAPLRQAPPVPHGCASTSISLPVARPGACRGAGCACVPWSATTCASRCYSRRRPRSRLRSAASMSPTGPRRARMPGGRCCRRVPSRTRPTSWREPGGHRRRERELCRRQHGAGFPGRRSRRPATCLGVTTVELSSRAA